MKNISVILAVVALFFGGCGWWSSDNANVQSLTYYVYDNVFNEDGFTSMVKVDIVPDYKNRTLDVSYEVITAMASVEDDANSGKNEGIVGGSHFDSFVELIDVLGGLEPVANLNNPLLSLEVLLKDESEPVVYQVGANYGDAEAPLYDFYANISPLFSQDIY